MTSPLVWTKKTIGRSRTSQHGHLGDVLLFVINPPTGATSQLVDADGTPAGPVVASGWTLTSYLPASDRQPNVYPVKSAADGKATAERLLIDFHRLLDPHIDTCSRYTIDINPVPPTDLAYNPDQRVYVERGPHGWAVRHSTPAGPIYNFATGLWTELDKNGDLADYDVKDLDNPDGPATHRNDWERPFEEARKTAYAILGMP
ncbi:hypothetical protein [Planomonospora sp. ID82291]|uniref:hypothetical protein n=1 Tax=Planomonospora sp. ID82291 TaxID=2738136 RepID=UPI0018C3FAF4|nr:hypothetical protein [Planomonospora sp. ID82291]MBG0818313.1 hypothetical protein [Planomonospora sp. ID82291]